MQLICATVSGSPPSPPITPAIASSSSDMPSSVRPCCTRPVPVRHGLEPSTNPALDARSSARTLAHISIVPESARDGLREGDRASIPGDLQAGPVAGAPLTRLILLV